MEKISKAKIAEIAARERKAFASLGGKARAQKLTKKRRREIASKGGKAGGRGRKKTPKGKAAA